ncbi:ATP-dependent DNA helicase DDX11-like isoform X1 [Saccostrea echinata]|uniref:ATP-dependent DNA helicase DDX11-like isoform X1 n=1 Tax=Saccostrea echinata TaxID=191078 RepID=UPI002A807C38|nr:ATP-dependent DNA helicase DDX11-like isoform X1 [Saccostrea echinata]
MAGSMDDFDEEGDDLLASFVENKDDLQNNVPVDFPFPFEAYDIQKKFMENLYLSLDKGQVGIFESPTGTGKSLSLICGALKWLKDYQEKQKRDLEALIAEEEKSCTSCDGVSGELDWITQFAVKKEKQEKLDSAKQKQQKLEKQESRLLEIGKQKQYRKRKRDPLEEEFEELMKEAAPDVQAAYLEEIDKVKGQEVDQGDDDLVPEDYHSDEEVKSEDVSDSENSEEEVDHVTKIYYCSRTHSQLAQFVREIVKSPYGSNTRVLTLGSRQNLCVNETVKKLKSLSLMNDMCLDLQKNKSKKIDREPSGEAVRKRREKNGGGCLYYRQETMEDLGNRILTEITDVEQIVKAGRQMKACPYYTSRLSIPLAEVVVLPYNIILHKSTREASGIRLEGNVVLIDEAHNLLETINSVYSVTVTGAQLTKAHSQLSQYEQRFRSRLKAKNLLYVKQILYILNCLVRFLGGRADINGAKQSAGKYETKVLTVNQFLSESGFDNINLFKILQYCRKSQISKKLNGFLEKHPNSEVSVAAEKAKEKNMGVAGFLKEITQNVESSASMEEMQKTNAYKGNEESGVMRSPLMHIEGFFASLTSADKDGRIVLTKQPLMSNCSLKFLLMNPAVHFKDVLTQARSVIVAGGTMQPIDEFKQQLFFAADIGPERILEYSCGHVIASDHLFALAMKSGPMGIDLDFTFGSRENSALLNELGLIVSNICGIIPGGLVCFFPSYDYQNLVYQHWQKSGILTKLERKKRIFQEPKLSSQVEHVLGEYSKSIQKSSGGGSVSGAILLCVVGGKMSEGINFSDDLGRGVIMVGMPYPNIKSPELQEKMQYLNSNFPRDKNGHLPGQVHYENLCMKTVNQSIGRAIRHREDYATILLLDKRYCKESVRTKLPSWIGKNLQKMEKYGPAVAAISQFFRGKKSDTMN